MGDPAKGVRLLPLLSAVSIRLSVLLLVLVAGVAAPALAVDFSALWDYQTRGGDNIDTASQFQQRYTLGLGPAMSFQLTPAIFAGANLGYARTERDLGEGRTTVEEITPSAQLGVTNDIFRSILSGTATEFRPITGEKFTTRAWDATLASNWQYDLWPSLSLNYSERNEETRGLAGAVGSGTEDKTFSSTLNWDLRKAQLYYDYSRGHLEDLVNQSRNDRESHLVRLETSQSFWQNRIRFNLAQQVQHADSDFTILTPDGLFEALLEIVEIRSLVTDSVVAPSPEDPGFDDLPEWSPSLPAVPVANGERVHLVASLDFPQQVDRLDLYVDPLAVDGHQVASLGWNLYVRSGNTWVLEAANLPALFNVIEERVELTVELLEPVREFMVTADVDGLPGGLAILRFAAVSRINVDTTSNQLSFLTNASLRIQLTPTLTASSSLILDRIESETERLVPSETAGEIENVLVSTERVSTQRSLAGSLRWTPSPFVTPSVSFSETRQESTGADDELSRSYSAIIATYPLPTLNVTLGATRTDRFTDARKTATSDNYSLTSTASIYPDLTASLNTNFITSDRQQTDGTMVTTDTLSSRLTLNARLNTQLTADLTNNYRHLNPPAAESTSATDSTLSLTWRPSDLLMLRGSGTKFWSGRDDPEPMSFIMDLALLRTRNTRLNLLYNHSRGRETSNQYSLNGSWDITQALSLQARLNYRSAEFDTWSTLLRLALRL